MLFGRPRFSWACRKLLNLRGLLFQSGLGFTFRPTSGLG